MGISKDMWKALALAIVKVAESGEYLDERRFLEDMDKEAEKLGIAAVWVRGKQLDPDYENFRYDLHSAIEEAVEERS